MNQYSIDPDKIIQVATVRAITSIAEVLKQTTNNQLTQNVLFAVNDLDNLVRNQEQLRKNELANQRGPVRNMFTTIAQTLERSKVGQGMAIRFDEVIKELRVKLHKTERNTIKYLISKYVQVRDFDHFYSDRPSESYVLDSKLPEELAQKYSNAKAEHDLSNIVLAQTEQNGTLKLTVYQFDEVNQALVKFSIRTYDSGVSVEEIKVLYDPLENTEYPGLITHIDPFKLEQQLADVFKTAGFDEDKHALVKAYTHEVFMKDLQSVIQQILDYKVDEDREELRKDFRSHDYFNDNVVINTDDQDRVVVRWRIRLNFLDCDVFLVGEDTKILSIGKMEVTNGGILDDRYCFSGGPGVVTFKPGARMAIVRKLREVFENQTRT